MADRKNSPSTAALPCEGWWDEIGLGRQAMEELKLRIVAGKVTGSGWDVVGPFTFHGTISEAGTVAMIKQYIGQHQVQYLGNYDGEGSMFGSWRLGNLSDHWAIRFTRPLTTPTTVGDDVPELR
ncbi:hypothetical protein NA78x_004653 [Anatilimnocola sp. NA78]|uniref:hypothetical protein n=1 Tax=Anatilimnocola sp. NA78 TaxID=3415683 RepID=UPI003CE577E3